MEALIITAVLYFLPTLVAFNKKRDNTGAIFLLNLFSGWSGIGWLAALVWAAKKESSSSTQK